MPGFLPSELRLSNKWDICIERTFINVTTGALVAGLASFVLFRKGPNRTVCTLFGVGVGVGNSWARCSIDFETEKKDNSEAS